jgi:serine/threonine-protein kinase
MIGSTVSQYRITERIGEGGMGVVYKAHDTRLDRTVALKFLSLKAMDDEARSRFIGEAQAAARVQHPNICPVYEIGEYEGQLFFAMAFLEGKTVAHLIRQGPVPITQALDIAIQVANGLEAAHKQGVIHRDIKAGNITVDGQGHVWILDFGVALRTDSESVRLTATGRTVGTPAYMSPEQAQAKPLDGTTDIWSMAVVLHEMLTGKLPFQGTNQFEMLEAIVREEAPTASSERLGVPSSADDFLSKALMKDPAKRWQTAGEAAAELRRIRDGMRYGTTTATKVLPVVAQGKSRRKLLAARILSVAVLAGGGYWAWHARTKLPDEKRIAVLPLDVVGNDPAVRTLADGLVETLSSKLSQIEEFQGKLMVVPSSEVRNRKIMSAEAARRIYDANLVITGSAQRLGDRIEFTLNLVDTASVRQLGSKTFEFDAEKPIALRDEAVNGTVNLLALKLTPAETGTLASGETQTPGAFADYLKGIGYLARYDLSGNVDRAIESLTHATRLDAKYALAFAALGQAHWVKAQKTETDKEEVELALESIREAIRLDPRLAEAHVRLGAIYANTGQPQEGIREAQSALKISPGNAEAYLVLGQAFERAGQFAEAENAYREAVKQKPADWHGHMMLGLFYYNRGRNAEARAAWDEALKLTPDNEVVHRNLAALNIREGKFQEASEQLAKAVKFEPNARTYSTLGAAYYYQRRYAEAEAALKSGVALDSGIYSLWGNLGTVYRHLPGSEQKAREAFETAIRLAEKRLEALKSDENTSANLAEYWAKLGNKDKALAAIAQIPIAARGAYADRIALAYELTGNRQLALETVKAIPAGDSLLTSIRNDPDLEGLR